MSTPLPPADSPAEPERIEAEAAAWLSLRDRGMSAEETAEFVRWLQDDARHAAVFEELDAVWRDCDRLAAVPSPAAGDLPPDGDLLAPRARPRRALARLGLPLAAAAAIAVGLLVFNRPADPTLSTGVGAFQTLDLPDGSVLQLNTDSTVVTHFNATERRVAVTRGEVFFSVAKDPARPFIVTTGPVAVRAVGTAFNVRRRDAAVEVLVTEGRVHVGEAGRDRSLLPPASPAATEPPVLAAGERAVVAVASARNAAAPAVASVTRVSPADVQRALAWQERRLEFDAVPLAEVAGEFNRYNRTRLVIADPALAQKRFSGTFRADGYETLVRLLETDFGVTAARRDREIVLRPAR